MKAKKIAAVIGVFFSLAATVPAVAAARHGADNPPGDTRGGHGADDGGGHH